MAEDGAVLLFEVQVAAVAEASGARERVIVAKLGEQAECPVCGRGWIRVWIWIAPATCWN
ncbi:hypothetical protein V7793_06240 [Streptomyces sp. KLMMK]|uniref:hypothetical protein n=1 Tax=Streptomyces sp. KLMMK TaxID=3109353 RepID=UPI002FFFAA9E